VPSFTHVLADEYQDLNRADQTLVDRLAGAGSVVVVGDPGSIDLIGSALQTPKLWPPTRIRIQVRMMKSSESVDAVRNASRRWRRLLSFTIRDRTKQDPARRSGGRKKNAVVAQRVRAVTTQSMTAICAVLGIARRSAYYVARAAGGARQGAPELARN
jgi:hypothetical protein